MSLICSDFAARKDQSINDLLDSSTDRSPKGSVDEPIWPLINLINQSNNYYTTSSCSGRISAFQHTSSVSIKTGKWIVCEHGKVTFDQVMNAWNQSNTQSNGMSNDQSNGQSTNISNDHLTVLKFEPFIVSVACRSLQAATDLLTIAIGAGCRESGIMAVHVDDQPINQSAHQAAQQSTSSSLSGQELSQSSINLSRPIMVSIRCSIRLEAPLSKAGKLIVDPEYLKELVDQSNHKFDLNQKRIDRFTESFRQWLEQHELNDQSNKKWYEKSSDSSKPSTQQSKNQSIEQPAETESMRKLRERQNRLVEQIQQLDQRINEINQVISQSSQSKSQSTDGSINQSVNVDDHSNRSWCLIVPRQFVNVIRGACKKLDFNDLEHKPSSIKQPMVDEFFSRTSSDSSKDDWMSMPINARALKTINQSINQDMNQQSQLLHALGLSSDAMPDQSIYLHFYAHPTTQPKPAINQLIKQSPQRMLQHKLELFVKENSLHFPLDRLADCTFKWEQFGDLVILSHHSFNQPINQQLINQCTSHSPSLLPALYQTVAQSLKCARLAVQHPIESTLHRRSHVKLLIGDHARVKHRENSVIFEFDAGKTMFSSGNGTEKQRLIQLVNQRAEGEDCLVDLYAGIGFWVCPVLVHTAVKRVIAFEHNADTFSALESSLKANRIDSQRYQTHCMDNRLPSVKSMVANCADRVLLGLLPSSEEAWSTALIALKTSGGVLHVHANVHETEHQAYAQNVANKLKSMLSEIADQTINQPNDQSMKRDWSVDVDHVEWVKSFAPHVDHIVVDIRCGPAQSSVQSIDQVTKQSGNQSINSSLHVYRRGGVLSYDNPSFDQFWRVTFPASKPALLRGLDIGSVNQFTIDQLSLVDCSMECSVHVCPELNGRMDFVNKNYIHRVMPFNQFIQRIKNQQSVNAPSTNHSVNPSIEESQPYFITPSEKYYLRSLGADPRAEVANFNQSFPMLAAHFRTPEVFAQRFSNSQSVSQSRMFSSIFRVSSAGISLWTHYDAVDNVLCHLSGVKRVVLFPPGTSGDLYVAPSPHSSSSPILDVDSTNQTRWPRFANAQQQGIEVILQPGDCLFIPALWFHHVDAITECVSVNLFWRELPENVYQPKDLYGNADVKPGVRAMELGKDIGDVISQLPTHYQQFYATRAFEAARQGRW